GSTVRVRQRALRMACKTHLLRALVANPDTRRTAEGTLGNILTPSLEWRIRLRLRLRGLSKTTRVRGPVAVRAGTASTWRPACGARTTTTSSLRFGGQLPRV